MCRVMVSHHRRNCLRSSYILGILLLIISDVISFRPLILLEWFQKTNPREPTVITFINRATSSDEQQQSFVDLSPPPPVLNTKDRSNSNKGGSNKTSSSITCGRAFGTSTTNSTLAPQNNEASNERAQRLLLLAEKWARVNSNNEKERDASRKKQSQQVNPGGGNVPLISRPISDSLSSLLAYNSLKGDWKDYSNNHNTQQFHVAIIFGKQLISDQITVEYASRIKTVVKLMMKNKQENNIHYEPSLIFFCGDTRRRGWSSQESNSTINNISTTTGSTYFQYLCNLNQINLDGIQIIIDNTSINENEVVQFVTDAIKNKYLPKWWFTQASAKQSQEPKHDNNKFLGNYQRNNETTTVKIHFTFISNDYHLSNFNDIHHRTPRQSCMKPIERLQQDAANSLDASFLKNYYFHDDNVGKGKKRDAAERLLQESISDYPTDVAQQQHKSYFLKVPRRILETSWSFQYAPYPFTHSKDEVIAFLGKIYLLGEGLVPLLVNMKGVIQQARHI
jgi:hypothetical protein